MIIDDFHNREYHELQVFLISLFPLLFLQRITGQKLIYLTDILQISYKYRVPKMRKICYTSGTQYVYYRIKKYNLLIISLSSDHKKMKYSSFDSPHWDVSNGTNFAFLDAIDIKILHFLFIFLRFIKYLDIYRT